MKSILDPKFKYVDSAHTNIAATFKRIIAEQKKRQSEQPKVVPMRKAGK
jgi:hypothetical protein